MAFGAVSGRTDPCRRDRRSPLRHHAGVDGVGAEQADQQYLRVFRNGLTTETILRKLRHNLIDGHLEDFIAERHDLGCRGRLQKTVYLANAKGRSRSASAAWLASVL